MNLQLTQKERSSSSRIKRSTKRSVSRSIPITPSRPKTLSSNSFSTSMRPRNSSTYNTINQLLQGATTHDWR